MAIFARWQATVTDEQGNTIPRARVEVRQDVVGLPLATLYSDRSGLTLIGNPILADENGFVFFHVAGGPYRIRAYTGDSLSPTFERVWRYAGVGTAAERDLEDLYGRGILIRSTRASLLGITPAEETDGAFVIGDPNASYNGVYSRESSAWVRQRGFPDTAALMTQTNSDVNAITASLATGVDPAVVQMFFLRPVGTNTTAVTINGKSLLGNTGVPTVPGEVIAGRFYIFTDVGGSYQLLTPSDLSGSVDAVIAAAASAQASRVAAQNAASDAALSRDASFALGPKYATEALGRAAVADGAVFLVQGSGLIAAIEYRRTSSTVSVEIGRYPAARFPSEVSQAQSLRVKQPNLVPTSANDLTADPFNAHTAPLTVSTYAGLPCWKSTTSGTIGSSLFFERAISFFPSGIASASVRVLRLDPAGTGATSNDGRFLMSQFDSSNAEITAARQVVNIVPSPFTTGTSSEVYAVIENIALDPLCAKVRWTLIYANTNATTDRTIYFREILFGDGPNGVYRDDGSLLSTQTATRAQTIAGTLATVAVTPDSLLATTQDRAGWSWTPNDFPDPTFSKAGATVSWSIPVNIVTKNSRRTLETPLSAAATSRRSPVFSVANYASKTWSASVVIEEKLGVQALADLQVRVLFFDASMTQLTVSQTGADVPAAPTYYARYVPTAAIASPQTLIIGENIAVPATAVWASFDVRVQTNTVQAYLTKFTMREGKSSSFKDGNGLLSAFTSVGTGGAFSRLDDAIDSLGGSGYIFINYDAAGYGSEMCITPSKVTGKITILGQFTGPNFPLVRLGTKAVAITKTAGQTQIYEFATTGITATPNFIWIDGLADASTAISQTDRRPQQGGRATRLSCTQAKATTATTLSTAMAEMDASSSPKIFYSTNKMYITGPAGMNMVGASVYIDGVGGLINTGTIMSNSEISISGLEVRYGGINLRPFRRSELNNVVSLGSQINVVDYAGTLIFQNLETCGGGSFSAGVGDGLNGHNGAWLLGDSLFSHDNLDDGESNHEYGRVRLRNGLFMANGGTAVAPAYGCDAIYTNCTSIGNQTVPGRKPGAFAVIGTPSDSGALANDGGVDTNVMFINCESWNDTVSFSDASQSGGNQAICRDCDSYNASTTAFDVYKIKDCTRTGTATMKTAKVIVENRGTLIT